MKYSFLLFFAFLGCTDTEVRTKKYPNGQLMYSKEYNDGVKNGLSIFYKENGAQLPFIVTRTTRKTIVYFAAFPNL